MPKLNELLKGIDAKVYPALEIEITGIAYNSRKVEAGNIFVALKGLKDDGKNYIQEAKEKGAVAIVTEEKIDSPLPLILVSDCRLALAQLAINFYRHPSEELLLIGVTGTNGKTTVTYLIESILNSAGEKTALLGTINYRIGKEIFSSGLTTPESVDLQRIFAEIRNKNIKNVIMEVSSHALSQKRIYGCNFDIAIYTNLSLEHLDFHQTMENYFLAKTKLFTEMSSEIKKNFPKFAIINLDCPWGEKIIDLVKTPVITYSIKKKSDFRANEIKLEEKGSSFILTTSQGKYSVSLPLFGKYNISNALAALAATNALGIDLEKVISTLPEVTSIPGRLERIDLGQPFTVVVDYAHTPDALKNVLVTLGELKKGRIITVFGCGGDRDRSKRPLMGEIAAQLSDKVIITTDNPRSEKPEEIALDIEVGIRRIGKDNYQVIPDRKEAIKEALFSAEADDLVLIAGKGHENYQIFADHTIHFSDREIVAEFLCGVSSWKKS